MQGFFIIIYGNTLQILAAVSSMLYPLLKAPSSRLISFFLAS